MTDTELDLLVERLVAAHGAPDCCECVRCEAADAIVALRAERDGLRKYARHSESCDQARLVGFDRDGDKLTEYFDGPCICGLAQLSTNGGK